MKTIRSGGSVLRCARMFADGLSAAALPLFLIPPRVAQLAPQASGAPDSASLLTRQPAGFDRHTFERAAAAMRELPGRIPNLIAFARHQHQMLGRGGALMLLLLALAIGYGVFGRVRLARRIRQTLAPISQHIPGAGREWLAAIAEVIAAALLPVLLWLLWRMVHALTGFEGPLFIIAGQMLLAWSIYAAAIGTMYQLLVRPLLPIPSGHGHYLFRFARLLIGYAIAVEVCARLMARFGAPADVAALIKTALQLALILMAAAVTMRRGAVVALLPDVPNFLYRGFVALFTRFYPAIWLATLAIALIQLAGYAALADFLWERTWLPVGVFVAAVALNHLIQRALRQSLFPAGVARDNAAPLHRSLSRLVRYAIVVAALAVCSHWLGGFHPLYGLLSQPLLTLGDKPVSAVVVIKAVLIVIIFALSARLARDYCEFRIYPRHNVDPGAANAINTCIVYVIVAIGVLAAVEAVGLGLGTITLFAGALGIGIGMGLQSMANNLTSGFTLIFTRALRKGDIVTTGDTIGIIQEVGIRATRMKTFDAIEYLVPNSEFVDGKIVNWTRSDPFTRVHVPIGVAYDAPPEVVRRIMEEVAAGTPNVQPAPRPEVRFAGLGDSSLNFELLIWINVKDVQPERVRSDLYFALFGALKEAGIEIPFPQRDIHIRTSEGFSREPARANGAPAETDAVKRK